MPTPSHGDQQTAAGGEGHGVLHVGSAGAARDQGWPAIDIAIPDAPRGLIAAVTGQHDDAAQIISQNGNVGRAQTGAGSIEGDDVNHGVGSLAAPAGFIEPAY
jgi:hypothetical protein